VTWLLPASAQEFAEPCDVGVQWSADSTEPVVIADGSRLTVIVRVAEVDAGAEQERLRARSSGAEPFGVIVFDRCHAFVFGPPGQERLGQHRLIGRGLDVGAAHTVLRSAWAAAEGRPDLTHFVLTFPDQTLECLARAVSSARRVGTLAEVIQHVGTWMS
jgi:hypothetical protein